MPARHWIGTGASTHLSWSIYLFAIPVSLLAYRTLSAAAAFAIGFDSAPEPSSTGVLIKTLLGTWVMVMFLI